MRGDIRGREKKGGEQRKNTTMFIAALFVIVKTWKQPRCPSTEEWIKKLYTLEYYSAVKHQ